MALTVEAVADLNYTGAATTTPSVSYAMTNGTAGSDRVLVVAIQRDRNVTATYNGVAMTELEETDATIDGALYYMEDADLPTDTSAYDIEATYTGSRTDVDFLVLEISGAKQGVTPNSSGGGGNTDPHDLSHTTLVDAVAVFLFYYRRENRTMDSEPSEVHTQHLTPLVDAGTINDAKRIQEATGPTPAGAETYTWNPRSSSQFLAYAVDIEEAAGGGTTYPESLADGVVFGDTPTPMAALGASLSDGLALGDSPGAAATLGASLTDGVALGDSVSGLATFGPALTDGLRFGDSLSTRADLVGSLADGVTFGDTASHGGTLAESLADGLVLGDSPSPALTLGAALSDGVVVGDALAAPGVTFRPSLADGLVLGDGRTTVVTFRPTLSDGIVFGDTVTRSSGALVVPLQNVREAVSWTTRIEAVRWKTKVEASRS